MKILIATGLYPPDIGGPATHTDILEHALPLLGAHVVVVPFTTVRHLPPLIRHIRYLGKLYSAARHVDVLYALDPVSVGLPVLVVSWLSSKPFVLRVVGDYAWEQGTARFGVSGTMDAFVAHPGRLHPFVRLLMWVERLVAHHAQAIIVPSEYLKQIVTAWRVATPICVVYNACEAHASTTPHQAPSSSEYRLFSAGRLVPWKGFSVLMDVVARLRTEGVPAILAIAGDGPEYDNLMRHCDQHGLAEVVTFLGRLTQPALHQRVSASDVFVLNTGYEGLSHLLLEVMALGVPIVTTRIGGNPELITDGVSGLLVSYNDPEELYQALMRMYQNKQERQMFAEHARAHAASFTIQRMVSGISAVLVRAAHRQV